MDPIRIGIIGGSGLYRIDGLSDARELRIATPFGDPSDALMVGRLDGIEVAFLARHGRSHGLIPGEIPFRANLWALKSLGVQYLLSVSAVGSLREEIAPLDMVLPDQFIDLTRKREAPSSATAPSPTSRWPTRSARVLRGVLADAFDDAGFDDLACTAGAPTSASRGRRSRRGPSRTATAVSAPRSSA